MKSDVIRSTFLRFFEDLNHHVVLSGSLIPHNDPTLFFVNAGMVPFKDAFTGQEPRPYTRATSSQKCLRVSGKHNDLDNVGRTPRHHTFFEMLGNFSFGDYFKEDAIQAAWALLTDTLGVDPERLWVTVFEDDDEAYEIWKGVDGLSPDRIQRLGAKDNFWSMGDTGPCGPCSEIFYDHGEDLDPKGGGPATESPRYIEIWNLVFMQFDQAADGSRTPLPKPSIDTGMGLERIAAVLQGVYSNYDTDLFQPLIQKAAEVAGVKYGNDEDVDVALRVIADHARATAFLIGDGVMPSNEGRGYVLRRVMRRAIRFGVKVGIDKPFLSHVTDAVGDQFLKTYPELGNRKDFICEVTLGEEERFRRTLGRGMILLTDALDQAQSANAEAPVVPGEVAFTLSDTYGFPLDLTQLIAEERSIGVDAEGYKQALGEQQARGRAAWKGSGEESVVNIWRELTSQHGATAFTGHTDTEGDAKLLALFRTDGDELKPVKALDQDESGIALFDQTPFYAESGGQVGDRGQAGPLTVVDTTKGSDLHLHHVTCQGACPKIGEEVHLTVHSRARAKTQRNHTATHLMHAALQEALGEHVSQKGSLVEPDRLRFDFSHHKAVSDEELQQVEDRVNAQILRNIKLTTTVESIEAATERGATALFGEKYGDEVRVVEVPGCSIELCGGTHVNRTGDIGLFRIISEGGIAAGVRRIEAQTGAGALQHVRQDRSLLEQAAHQLKTNPARVVESIKKLQDERRSLEKNLSEANTRLARFAANELTDSAKEIGGVQVLITAIDGELKEQAEGLREQLGTSLIILVSQKGPKALMIIAASKDILSKGVHAGDMIRQLAPIIGGGGGGRPDLAQAGGKDPSKIPELLDAAMKLAEELLG